MQEFETKYLKKYTPCNFTELRQVAEAIAIVHVEFILIHPFREGNGRLGRVLASLMANQADYPPLDFSLIEHGINSNGFERYSAAIHAVHVCNYVPMKTIFNEIIDRSRMTD